MIDHTDNATVPVCVVSPCRDEMDYLARSVNSVLAQSSRPARWVIVDDGSTDGSSDFLDAVARQHSWITVVHLQHSGRRELGGGVIRAFNRGLSLVDLAEYEFVCKLDLDLDLPPHYFSLLEGQLRNDPLLASCSGKPFFRKGGAVEFERCGNENSVGMTKFYRVNAYMQIGGFVEAVMWDGIDCHRARQLGWRSRAFDDPELAFEHLRPMGSSDRGILRGRRRHGAGQYFMGSSLLFVLASAVLRVRDYPLILGSANMIAGYLAAAVRRSPRYNFPGFRRQLRRYQWESLVLASRAPRAVGRPAVRFRWRA